MIISKKELADILQLNINSIRNIKDDKLKTKLERAGYKFSGKKREGHKIFYEIEPVSSSNELTIYNNLCKYVYGITKNKEFGHYFTMRTSNEEPLNCADLADHVGVTRNTISKWDNTLLSKDIIRKDDFYYFCVDKSTGKIVQCEKEEYQAFWKNSALCNSLVKLQNRYLNGEITLTELQLASANAGALTSLIVNKYYFKCKRYTTNEENRLYIDTVQLLKDIGVGYDLHNGTELSKTPAKEEK